MPGFPVGGWRRPCPNSANSAWFQEQPSIRFSPGAYKTAIPEATCATASIISRFPKSPSVFGRRITSQAARPKELPIRLYPRMPRTLPANSRSFASSPILWKSFCAREGHNHPVGINYLEKVQLPHLPSIYGAMLAGVGYILMGAGVPLKIPGVLDRFANHEPATYLLQVNGAQEDGDRTMFFAPKELFTSKDGQRSLRHFPGRSSSPSSPPIPWRPPC